jgi:hypothetical protein
VPAMGVPHVLYRRGKTRNRGRMLADPSMMSFREFVLSRYHQCSSITTCMQILDRDNNKILSSESLSSRGGGWTRMQFVNLSRGIGAIFEFHKFDKPP